MIRMESINSRGLSDEVKIALLILAQRVLKKFSYELSSALAVPELKSQIGNYGCYFLTFIMPIKGLCTV